MPPSIRLPVPVGLVTHHVRKNRTRWGGREWAGREDSQGAVDLLPENTRPWAAHPERVTGIAEAIMKEWP